MKLFVRVVVKVLLMAFVATPFLSFAGDFEEREERVFDQYGLLKIVGIGAGLMFLGTRGVAVIDAIAGQSAALGVGLMVLLSSLELFRRGPLVQELRVAEEGSVLDAGETRAVAYLSGVAPAA